MTIVVKVLNYISKLLTYMSSKYILAFPSQVTIPINEISTKISPEVKENV